MRRILAPVLAAVVALAGCGGSGDDATATSTTAKLTGEPIRIGSIVERVFDQQRKEAHVAAEAAIRDINARGGIRGRPLQIEICDSKQNDPNSAVQCARDLVADPGIVAIVGMWSIVAAGASDILTQAGIASIANSPLGAADFQCKVCFPVSGGALASTAGQANLIDDLFGPKVGMAISDVPAGQQLVGLVKAVFAARKSPAQLDAVPVPVSVADVTAQLTAAADNDGIAIVIPRDTAFSFVRAASSSGVDVPMVISAQVMTEEDLKALGHFADGLYISNSYRITGPGIKAFNDQMDAVDSKALKTDPAKSMWIGVRLFADVVKKLDTVTRESVLSALPLVKGYETGLTPPLDFSVEFGGMGGALPRVFNTSVYYGRYGRGKVVPVEGDKPVDVFAVKKS